MMKIGCCIDFAELLSACETGFAFVDLSGKELVAASEEEFQEVSDLLTEHKIPCMGIHATLPGEIALLGNSFSEEILKNYMEVLAKRARELKIPYIGIGSPNSRKLENGMAKAEADKQMVHSLELICSLAPDMEILLESLNQEETNYINSMTEAYELIKKVNKDNIGLVWDIYHFIKCGEKLETLPKELFAHVKYLHIADPKNRSYPSEETDEELFETMKAAVRLTDTEYLAIEALTEDYAKDAFCGRMVLQKQMDQMEEKQ